MLMGMREKLSLGQKTSDSLQAKPEDLEEIETHGEPSSECTFSIKEINLKLVEYPENEIIGNTNKWWDGLLKSQNLNPRDETLSTAGYHTVELAKNAFENGDDKVKLSARINDTDVEIIVENDGVGFNPIEAQENSVGGGFGLKNAIEWADTFVIETGGKKFSKNNQLIELVGDSNIVGTKIVFTKKYAK